MYGYNLHDYLHKQKNVSIKKMQSKVMVPFGRQPFADEYGIISQLSL